MLKRKHEEVAAAQKRLKMHEQQHNGAASARKPAVPTSAFGGGVKRPSTASGSLSARDLSQPTESHRAKLEGKRAEDLEKAAGAIGANPKEWLSRELGAALEQKGLQEAVAVQIELRRAAALKLEALKLRTEGLRRGSGESSSSSSSSSDEPDEASMHAEMEALKVKVQHHASTIAGYQAKLVKLGESPEGLGAKLDAIGKVEHARALLKQAFPQLVAKELELQRKEKLLQAQANDLKDHKEYADGLRVSHLREKKKADERASALEREVLEQSALIKELREERRAHKALKAKEVLVATTEIKELKNELELLQPAVASSSAAAFAAAAPAKPMSIDERIAGIKNRVETKAKEAFDARLTEVASRADGSIKGGAPAAPSVRESTSAKLAALKMQVGATAKKEAAAEEAEAEAAPVDVADGEGDAREANAADEQQDAMDVAGDEDEESEEEESEEESDDGERYSDCDWEETSEGEEETKAKAKKAARAGKAKKATKAVAAASAAAPVSGLFDDVSDDDGGATSPAAKEPPPSSRPQRSTARKDPGRRRTQGRGEAHEGPRRGGRGLVRGATRAGLPSAPAQQARVETGQADGQGSVGVRRGAGRPRCSRRSGERGCERSGSGGERAGGGQGRAQAAPRRPERGGRPGLAQCCDRGVVSPHRISSLHL